MLPAIAIVGRPNVGKSTLFNQLTRSRDALVADQPGLTRDRQYGLVTRGSRRAIVVDTGGFTAVEHAIEQLTVQQALVAEQEANVIVFVVDAEHGLVADDEVIATRLRRYGKPLLVVANKSDRTGENMAGVEFHALGLGEPVAVSAAHGRGLDGLLDQIAALLPEVKPDPEPETRRIKVAIMGKPNVGKSTLVNAFLGEERVVAHDMPGTTRDSVYIPFEHHGTDYTLIDTAGVRRRSRIDEKVEKYSVIKSLQALEACNIAVVLIDASDSLSEQDLRLLGMVLESGRGLVIGVNKWDTLDETARTQFQQAIDRKLKFVDFARLHFISALEKFGLSRVLHSVDAAWAAATRDLPTPLLTRILNHSVERHPPPLVTGRRIKLRYAHQGGLNPPVIVIHGNQTAALPEAYRRYLIRVFRTELDLQGTPVRLELKTGKNPFHGRRNPLTERQKKRRKRMLRHQRGNR